MKEEAISVMEYMVLTDDQRRAISDRFTTEEFASLEVLTWALEHEFDNSDACVDFFHEIPPVGVA